MLSIPIAAHDKKFEWQLDLFWYAHREVYGAEAAERALAVIIERNTPQQEHPLMTDVGWGLGVPFVIANPFFDALPSLGFAIKLWPLNIQLGLVTALQAIPDDQVIELLDCDMFHFKQAPSFDIADNVLLVSTVYESWHLKSLTDNRHVISPYFENGGQYYNGGFVPIIGRASTFKRIISEWVNVHVDLVNRSFGEQTQAIHWWSGMFALQAACEKAKVAMVDNDVCYVPHANRLSDKHYVYHYSVDELIEKNSFLNAPFKPKLDHFPDQPNYNLVKRWYNTRKAT